MTTKPLCLTVLLLAIGCQQRALGAEKPPPPTTEAAAKPEPSKQLEIYETTLREGKSEQIRIVSATEMLFSEDPLAREILLAVLKQPANSLARAAVCKALSQARVEQRPIKDKNDFIAPLLEMLATDDAAEAKLAAEATLIFEYRQISEQLEKMVADQAAPVKARLNVIYALTLHPDKKAVIRLITLLEDPDKQVAAASEQALRSIGVSCGKDAEAREQIVASLKNEPVEAFLRNRLLHRETRMRNLNAELDLWQRRYRLALDRIYNAITEDAAKAQFLAEQLRGSETTVKLWALEKLAERRQGTDKPKLSSDIQSILLTLISDENRDVRLKTANLLSLIWELNSAGQLLAQLKVEQDDQVRVELFVALGGACYYASLPNSGITVSDDIRKQTLEWAAEYLSAQEPEKARRGADVIRKLLEQDGLSSGEVTKYLNLLAKRYQQQKNMPDATVQGELVTAMAGLCAQRSVCRAQAAKLFRPLFEEALSSEADLVRQAAVDGLIYVDKTDALKSLRKQAVNDPSPIVRKRLIDLAGEVGGKEDLPWLAEKVGMTGESEPAWQVMVEIFKRSDATILGDWIARFDPQGTKSKLSDEQRISFLEIAEQKAIAENKPDMRKTVSQKLAQLYSKTGQFEQAADYFQLLRQSAQTSEEKDKILPDLLDVYLRWPRVKLAADLVKECLLESDLDPNSTLVGVIDSYLGSPPPGADVKALLSALSQIEIGNPERRAMWRKQLRSWVERFGKVEASEESDKSGDQP
jgi:hypothetical protein